MTDPQLKIMLEMIANQLEQAIEKSAELMPEDAERCFSHDQCMKAVIDVENGDYGQMEEKPKGKYMAYYPLYQHLDLLREHIKNLNNDDLKGKFIHVK